MLHFLLVLLQANFKIWSNMEQYGKWGNHDLFTFGTRLKVVYVQEFSKTKTSFWFSCRTTKKNWGCPRMVLLIKERMGNMEQFGAIWKVGQPFPHDLFTFGISLKVAHAQEFIDGICLISGESCEFVCMVEEGETETITERIPGPISTCQSPAGV